MEIKWPGETLLLKLWETLIEKGIGSLLNAYYEPWKSKRMNLAQLEFKTKEMVELAKAEVQVARIKNQSLLTHTSENKVAELESSDEIRNILSEVVNSNLKNTIREEINVAKSALLAFQNIENEQDVEIPSESIDEDWLYQWRDYASKVSNEQVQSLWGNVLAGEFKKPGTYSLRTLEFLKTLTQREAQIIEKYVEYSFSSPDLGMVYAISLPNEIFPNDKKFLVKFDLNQAELAFLEELGIINNTGIGGYSRTFEDFDQENGVICFFQIDTNHRMLLINNEKKSEMHLKISFYTFTNLGREIISLINYSTNQDYIDWVGSQIAKELKVLVYKKEMNEYKLAYEITSDEEK